MPRKKLVLPPPAVDLPTVPDVIAPDLAVLFCGINPGLMSSKLGHHFARPGNRFWPAMHRGGFTPKQFHPSEERELLPLGFGITNVCRRPSARADELTRPELLEGGQDLRRRVLEWQPRFIGVLGIGAYREAFAKPKAVIGPQDEVIGETRVWALPNPSGLNAHFQIADLAVLFAEFRRAVEGEQRPAVAPG